jgi:WxL domain surface cell wall-binding
MSPITSRIARLSTGLVLATALAIGASMPAFAADVITSTLNAGTRTASVANLSLSASTYSHVIPASTGTMVLTVDDSTASGAGWNVTIVSSDFVYSGSNGGTNIPKANFSITSAAAPSMTAGQAVDVTDGPKVPTVSPVGTLDTARKVLQANAGFGQGTYTQDLGVSLSYPAQSRAGDYTGTLTTTISAAP